MTDREKAIEAMAEALSQSMDALPAEAYTKHATAALDAFLALGVTDGMVDGGAEASDILGSHRAVYNILTAALKTLKG